MRDVEFPNRPNGYEFLNWLYCPECGSKASINRYSPRFELSCHECGEEMDVVLGVTPPFHKVTPKDIEHAAEQNAGRDSMPYQQISVSRKLRELDDTEVARELEKAGYSDLADRLESD